MVFLASPGDVDAERAVARSVLDDVNRTVGREKGVFFDVVGWDTDSYPAFGGDGQAVLNAEIGDMSQHDLFVGIMWTRFGSPTPRADSGTEEELERAVTSLEKTGKPEIMFFFKREPSEPHDARAAEQKLKVMQFRERQFARGLVSDFADTQDFRAKFNRGILQWLGARSVRTPFPPAHHPEAEPPPAAEVPQRQARDSQMWVLLNDRFFEAVSVREDESDRIVIEVASQDAEDDAFFQSLRAKRLQAREPVSFAHRSDGGLATVELAEALSTAGGKVWRITLKREDAPYGFGTEMGVNGRSADDIAAMRARLLLLNEAPVQRTAASGRKRFELNDLMLVTAVRGINSPVKVMGSVFPKLWSHFKGDEALFLPLARLWAIFQLKASGTVENVLELTIGPRQGNSLGVRFRGRRHRAYSNVEPTEVEVIGDCDLTSTPPLGEE
jgi:hypothetical protein